MNTKRPNSKPLSEEEKRKRIILESKEGRPIPQIVSTYRFHEKFVEKIIRAFGSRRTFKRRKGAGRPKKLNQALKIAIRNKVQSFPWLSCDQIARNLGKQVCAESIRLYLKYLEYVYKSPCKKPKLSKKDEDERLKWARTHKEYDFSQIIFAGEASF